jgi:hypothetical protein
MAVQTLGPVFHLIPVGIIFPVAVHLLSAVALLAFEVFLLVNVGRNPFVLAQILLPDPTPMAGRANRVQGRPFQEEMPFQESTFHGIGTADVALPATAVAGTAVRIPRRIHLAMDSLIRIGPRTDRFSHRGQARVKAAGVMLRDVLMTRSADLGGIRIGWILDHTLMGRFPVGIIWIAAVTFVTSQLPVVFVFGNFRINPYLFMRSQRLHVSPSAFSF